MVMAFEKAKQNAINSPVSAAAPVLVKVWCGVLKGARVFDGLDEAGIRVKVAAWFPEARAIYKMHVDKEFAVHLQFPEEKQLVEAMSKEAKAVGLSQLMRCVALSGRCNCAHREKELAELVTIRMDFSSLDAMPVKDNDSAGKADFGRKAKHLVEALDSKPTVDYSWVRVRGNREKPAVFVSLVLHVFSDVDKVLAAEGQLRSLASNAVSVGVDVPNSPRYQICSACGLRGHNDALCKAKFGGPLAAKVIFNSPIDEVNRQQFERFFEEKKLAFCAIYTGLQIGVKQPHRCVWLTFDSTESCEAGSTAFFTHWRPLIKEMDVGRFPERAKAKCGDCGSPFHVANSCHLLMPQTSNGSLAFRNAVAQSSAVPAPADHSSHRSAEVIWWNEMPYAVCFDFWHNGFCKYRLCKFFHVLQQDLHGPIRDRFAVWQKQRWHQRDLPVPAEGRSSRSDRQQRSQHRAGPLSASHVAAPQAAASPAQPQPQAVPFPLVPAPPASPASAAARPVSLVPAPAAASMPSAQAELGAARSEPGFVHPKSPAKPRQHSVAEVEIVANRWARLSMEDADDAHAAAETSQPAEVPATRLEKKNKADSASAATSPSQPVVVAASVSSSPLSNADQSTGDLSPGPSGAIAPSASAAPMTGGHLSMTDLSVQVHAPSTGKKTTAPSHIVDQSTGALSPGSSGAIAPPQAAAFNETKETSAASSSAASARVKPLSPLPEQPPGRPSKSTERKRGQGGGTLLSDRMTRSKSKERERSPSRSKHQRGKGKTTSANGSP